jgi:hypothetical protein
MSNSDRTRPAGGPGRVDITADVQTITTRDPKAVLALPALFSIEVDLVEMRADMAAFHYGLGAALVRHGLTESADLALHEESAKLLRGLDLIRDRIGQARRLAARGL